MIAKKIVVALLLSSSLASAASASAAYSAMAKYKKHRILTSLCPVSYTHLDVYKRQVPVGRSRRGGDVPEGPR